MDDKVLTIMAVHAHPDDEVFTTGGVLARYSDEGIQTVLVTCTNGEQGDGPGGVKPGEDGHDEAVVVERRMAELLESAGHLGVAHVELLGYRDSGMVGWEANSHEGAFANIPLDVSTARLVELIERYRPQVVVAYDENGGYGHPDHIMAHRVAKAAVEASGIPAKLYYSATPKSALQEMSAFMKEQGLDNSEFEDEENFGTPDELITTFIDTSAWSDRKLQAMKAHASQGDSTWFLTLPPVVQQKMFGSETFILVSSTVDAPVPEDDLFAGLRD